MLAGAVQRDDADQIVDAGSQREVMALSGSHTRFALMNRVVNPFVRALLRSPMHGLLSGRLVLITVTGRRSGRSFTIPVGYRRTGDAVTITVGSPERKRWWRNLREERSVALVLGGARRTGVAHVHGDERGVVTVEVELDAPTDRPSA